MSENYDGPQMAQKIMRQQSEIERLRADLLTRDGQAQELQGEVERLRGLLIEYAENDGNPRWAADYRRRVREILGR
jgi:uncharacterized protein (DUF1330 family)